MSTNNLRFCGEIRQISVLLVEKNSTSGAKLGPTVIFSKPYTVAGFYPQSAKQNCSRQHSNLLFSFILFFFFGK